MYALFPTASSKLLGSQSSPGDSFAQTILYCKTAFVGVHVASEIRQFRVDCEPHMGWVVSKAKVAAQK